MREPIDPNRERWLKLEFGLLLAVMLGWHFELFRFAWDVVASLF